jgi:sulfatase-modifying factor enzyme 1/flagellar hook capping protein FlgD/two component regulator with propeller domain
MKLRTRCTGIFGVALLCSFASLNGQITNSSSIYFQTIDPCSFVMGHSSEGGTHNVTFTYSFQISRFETTQAKYEDVMGSNPSINTGDNSLPVDNVSWEDAVTFCNTLSTQEGLETCYNLTTWECDYTKNGYRLPTEAEWEFFCRSWTTSDYYQGYGEEALALAGWYSGNSSAQSHPVGLKKPCPLPHKHHDMHGNVQEWCNDWYGSSPDTSVTNSLGAETSTERVARGGSYADDALACRSFARASYTPGTKQENIGFRVVRGFFFPDPDSSFFTRFTSSDGLVNDVVSSIAIDSIGNMWFGTQNGVSKYDGTNWTSYTTTDGLINGSIADIAVDFQDNLWFATNGGVSKFDGSTWTTYTTDNGLAGNKVLAISVDIHDNLWFACFSSGISKYDGVSWTSYGTAEGMPVQTAYEIDTDIEGNVWIGTYGGIIKFDGTNWTHYTESGYAFPSINVVSPDSVWAAFGYGGGVKLYAFPDSVRYTVDKHNGLPSNTGISSIIAIPGGGLWIGMTHCLTNFNGFTWTTYTTYHGLPEAACRSLAVDNQGYLWIGAGWSGGVSRSNFTVCSPPGVEPVDTASVTDVAATASTTGADTAASVLDMVVSFTVPAGKLFGPDLADSLVYLRFESLPDGAGIPPGIDRTDVECSTDNVNYYAVLAVGQGGEGNEDSVCLAVALEAEADSPYYIRIRDFVNPSKSETSYGVAVATEASPVWAANPTAWAPGDGSYWGLKLLNPGGTMPPVPKYFDDIQQSQDTLTAGDTAWFRVVLGDRHGNVVSLGAGSMGLIFKGPDTTRTGDGTIVGQRSTAGHGANMFDTLWVSYDTLANGDYSIIDSIFAIPALAGEYYLTVIDSAESTIRDSVALVVRPGITGSLVKVSPLGMQYAWEEAEVDSALTVALLDPYGNALPDSIVRFIVIQSVAEFIDSNGVAVAVPNDTIFVAADTSGQASVRVKTGITCCDTVKVMGDIPSNSAVAEVYFLIATACTGPSSDTTCFHLKNPPDSVVQDTSAGVLITADIRDNGLTAQVRLRAITTVLVMDAGVFTASAVSDTLFIDKVYDQPDDSAHFEGTIPAQKIWEDSTTRVAYDIRAIDNDNDTVWSPWQGMYIIGPKTGKADLTAEDVKLGDVLRAVYLFLNAEGIIYRAIDYMGLDIDCDRDFTMPGDVLAVLDLWRGGTSSAALASAAGQEGRAATVSMAYTQTEKACGALDILLENRGNLSIAGFRVKYDADKFILGEVQPGSRLDGLEVYFGNNETEGVYSVAVVNIYGGLITSGSGVILSIPVSATGKIFDGEGEISLLSAEFEKDVAVNLEAAVLSPKTVLPKAFSLAQNAPNPFNPSTTIAFSIPEGKSVKVVLEIFNIRGQLVQNLVDEVREAGTYSVVWDGTNKTGRKISSGVYFYRLRAGKFVQTRKMVVLK